MNTMSASPAEAPGGQVPARGSNEGAAARADPTLVWDAPVRLFHGLMVLCFAGAWLTAESEPWRLVHVTLGYTMAGLVGFRLLWGLVGTRHARFGSFVRGPAAAWRYLKSLRGGRPEHHAGHNPAGALAIVALLALAALVSASGWAVVENLGGEWLEEAHEVAATAMLAVVLVHVAGVAFGSWAHRENLVRAMVTGRRPGSPDDAIPRAWTGLAVLILAAVLAFWAWQWQTAPSPPLERGDHAALVQRHDAGDDDDQDDD